MARDVQAKWDGPREPTHGWTELGHAVHAVTSHHLPSATTLQRLNSWVAVRVTRIVGTMWCAYAFCVLSFYGLPAAMHGSSAFVQWASSQFVQLVLLPIILVGQDVQARAGDARAAKTFEDVERVLAAQQETRVRTEEVYAAVMALAPKQINVSFPAPRPPKE